MSAQSNPITPSLVSGITPEAQITLLHVIVADQEISIEASGAIIQVLCQRLTSQQKEIDRLTREQRTRTTLEAIARPQGG